MEKRAGRPMGFAHPCNPKAYNHLLRFRIGPQVHVEELLGAQLHITGHINIAAKCRGMPNT